VRCSMLSLPMSVTTMTTNEFDQEFFSRSILGLAVARDLQKSTGAFLLQNGITLPTVPRQAPILSRVDQVLFLASCLVHRLDDLINNGGIGQRRSVPELVLLACEDFSQDAAHDLT